MPPAWCNITTFVNQLHYTMCVPGSPGRVIWPVWWLVTTMMAENSALEYVHRLIIWRGRLKPARIAQKKKVDNCVIVDFPATNFTLAGVIVLLT